MANPSEDRKRHESEIRRLLGQGMPERIIASRLGVSRGMVQRVKASTPAAAVTVSADEPADAAEVKADYETLYKNSDDGSLGFLREMWRVALVCHSNGYNVKCDSLRFIMALTHARNETESQREREELDAEIMEAYAHVREWRDRNLTDDEKEARKPPEATTEAYGFKW
jgi:DNA invertase Pin-like site-specific DNA recombinase